jgi:hypothetical protein
MDELPMERYGICGRRARAGGPRRRAREGGAAPKRREEFVHVLDGDGPFPDRRGDALHGPVPNISCGEDAGDARLEAHGRT